MIDQAFIELERPARYRMCTSQSFQSQAVPDLRIVGYAAPHLRLFPSLASFRLGRSRAHLLKGPVIASRVVREHAIRSNLGEPGCVRSTSMGHDV
jgi:hypothetical protein